MAENLITTTVTPKQLKFKPGGIPGSFEVSVTNDSDRFATFQVEVTAAGTDPNQKPDWYTISPEVSTKKPPGDSTNFHILILDTPVPGFVGVMNLTIRVFSLELPDEDREVVRLVLEQGIGSIVLKLDLPVREFQEYPGNQDEIPLRITNPGQLPTNVTLRFLGLDPLWIVGGIERHLQIPAGGQISETFICQLPNIFQASSQVYPFKIEATHSNGPMSWVEGTFEVLPMGSMEFTNNPDHHQIPARLGWLLNWRNPAVTYELQFENRSNLNQLVNIEVQGEDQQQCTLELSEQQTEIISGQEKNVQLIAKARRPWLGRVKNLLLEVNPILSDQRLGSTNPSTQILKLDVFPMIPLWLFMSGGLLLLWLIWWISWLNPNSTSYGHKDAVNSVEFNGMSQNVVSGSSDQKLIKWRVDGFFNPFVNPEVGDIANSGKAVRVIRYQPLNNNVVAAGLENGEIQLLNLLGETPKLVDSFSYQKDDRVFALEFTDDSRYLFSGHGSGLVLQWDVQQNLDELSSVAGASRPPLRGRQFKFAVYALKFVGQNNINLAIGGRFNQLWVWKLSDNSIFPLPYPTGSQKDYISSLDTAQLKPYLFASGDTQGRIILWDMESCIVRNRPCEIIDQWSNGHGSKPVRSVALSNGGCYLASAGDDGRMMLWPLTREGKRVEEFITGTEIGRSFNNKKFNSIDINVLKDDIYIASGSDDTQVRVKRIKRLQRLGCDRD